MDLRAVPFRSPLSAYAQQAENLLAGHRAADPAAIHLFHRKHPRFLDEKITWRPKFIADSEIRDAALSLDDARLAVARSYDFLDWPALAACVEAVSQQGSVFEFESAVEAVVNGDLAGLDDALRRDPDLVRARSSRVCCFDPPVHRATLLHYVAANGVEAYRQKTPPQRRRGRPRAAPGRRRARRPRRYVRRPVHSHEHAGVEQPSGRGGTPASAG